MLRVSSVEKLLFTRELSVLLKSGVSLREALVSLSEQSDFSSLRGIVRALILDIENGQTLAHACSRHPKVFDHLYVNLVVIGERTGSLSKNLSFLALQLEKSYQLRKKIESILLYPAIVFGTAVTLASLISVFILPKLVKLFDSFQVGLPLSTKVLLWFAALMKAHGVVLLLSMLGCLVAFRVITWLPRVRPYWHRFLLRLPVVGVFLRSLYLAQFFRDMGVMLQSGLPLAESLLVEEKAARNQTFSQLAHDLYQDSLEGKSLATSLTMDTLKLVPSTVIKMVSAGEQSGRLGETFLYLGDFLDEEVDRGAKNFTVILEPMLLIFIAALVVFLALAILSPIYSLTGSVHR